MARRRPPSRKSAPKKKRSTGRKKASGARKPRRSKGRKRAPAPTLLQRAGRACLRVGSALFVGGGAGIALSSWALYEQAKVDVESLLSQEVWAASGEVLSAPIEVWPGLALTPAELGEDLVAAGYAKVDRAESPGDVQVAAQDVFVKVREASGPGWELSASDVHVSFSAGRVAAISPRRRATFAPALLSEVRGSDNESRRPVSLSQVPDHLVQAILAMEDARFYEHEGLDPIGILRAVVVNTLRDRPMQGGSTLTQQLVKNLFLTQERTLERKGKEALLSIALENTRSKDEILELYLNEIYLGQAGGASVCGVEQAARLYFGKTAARLTLSESATLAGIVSAPNRYSPLRHADAAAVRRDLVLDRMVRVGFVEPGEAEAVKATPLVTNSAAAGRRAPWAVDAALETIESALGDSGAALGVAVHTTLQPALQRLAERAVQQGAAELDTSHPEARGAQFALAAVRVRDGAIVALVGGRNYASSQFNRAVYAHRQVGSTVKPLTALAAFDADPNLSGATLLEDKPIVRTSDGKRWEPRNYDGRFLGEVSLRSTVATSRNIPSVLLAEEVGMRRLRQSWKDLGLSRATANPAASLGSFEATPVEVAGAYTVFPGGGRWARPSLVRAAVRPDGSHLWHEEPVVVRRAGAESAFLATELLQAVVDEGTGRKATRWGASGAVGGKTGTTDRERDAWFVGVTPELAVAVWVGFDKGRALGLTGSEAALPTWSRFVAASGTTGGSFPQPSTLVTHTLCTQSHAPASADCPETREEWFRPGSVPRGGCPVHGGLLEGAGGALSRAWEGLTGGRPDIRPLNGKDRPPREAAKPKKKKWFQRR